MPELSSGAKLLDRIADRSEEVIVVDLCVVKGVVSGRKFRAPRQWHWWPGAGSLLETCDMCNIEARTWFMPSYFTSRGADHHQTQSDTQLACSAYTGTTVGRKTLTSASVTCTFKTRSSTTTADPQTLGPQKLEQG